MSASTVNDGLHVDAVVRVTDVRGGTFTGQRARVAYAADARALTVVMLDPVGGSMYLPGESARVPRAWCRPADGEGSP